MNIYFLVEGQSTEPDVYPAWLSFLLPGLIRVHDFDEVAENNYYLFSSYGIPYIGKDIINAVRDINSMGRYNYFVICLDADSATVSQREAKIIRLIRDEEAALISASLRIIVQNRCIETWFLGNRKVYTRNPQKNPRFIEYSEFYDVSRDDPELMGKHKDYHGSISDFHVAYLKAMFDERGNMRYSKSNSAEVQKPSYLTQLQKRVDAHPSHLRTFDNFLKFCAEVRTEMSEIL